MTTKDEYDVIYAASVKMMKIRGYDLSTLTNLVDLNYKTLTSDKLTGINADSYVVKNKTTNDTALVFFSESDKTGKNKIKLIPQIICEHYIDHTDSCQKVANLKDDKFTVVVIIHPIPLQPQSKLIVDDIARNKIVQVFDYDDLLIDPLNCAHGVQYSLVTDENLLAELKQRKLKDFPRIFTTDPPVKYLGFKHNDIIQIIKPYTVDGHAIQNEMLFRLVIGKSIK